MKIQIKLLLFILSMIICFSTTTGCDLSQKEKNSDGIDNNKLIVAVTILPQQAFVKKVCGDLADIITIVPPGSSPENYEPTTKQLEGFSDADIYFTIGVPVEESKMLPEAKNTFVVDLSKKVSSVYVDRFFEGESRDPHIWLSPKRVIVMVNTIAEELGKIDPDNKSKYISNAAAYINELEQLDAYIKNLVSNVKNSKNVFLTFHPAYGYFAQDYGLSMYSLEQEGREATMQDLLDMIDFAKEKGIKVLFIQAESSSSQPKVFIDEVGGEVKVLNPLSEDYINNIKSMAELIVGAVV